MTISGVDFVDCFIETFDKSAVNLFKRWLSTVPPTTKWLISADFVLRDKSRPGDCFAFTVLPYDTHLNDFQKEVHANLPRDLKDSKTIEAEAISWLRSQRHFHIVVPINQDRVLHHSEGQSARQTIGESLRQTTNWFVQQGRANDQIKRLKAAEQKTHSNSFNVGLFTDMNLLALLLAVITVLLCRERKPERVGWMCDRDSMLNYCDGIIWDIAGETFRGIAERLQVDRNQLTPDVALPDKSSGKEVMWFDHYIRAPDWLAGVFAAWNRTTNEIPSHHDKYLKMVQDVISDSENIVALPIKLDLNGIAVNRVTASKFPPDTTAIAAQVQPCQGK